MGKGRSDFLATALFCASFLLLGFAFGFAAGKYQFFPYDMLGEAEESARVMKRRLTGQKSWLYIPTTESRKLLRYVPGAAYPGLNLVTAIGADNRLAVFVMDMAGTSVHSWEVDWFKIWPDATHVPEWKPKEQPGTHIHGAVVLADGDIVYNYEYLGLVRLDLCGHVVWRLPYWTHHSVHLDDEGDLWVSAQRKRVSRDARDPNHGSKFSEPVTLEVSEDGRIKSEISVLQVLRDNDLNGLLYMSKRDKRDTSDQGDTLHLNDVEPFPSAMRPGAFAPGDLLISLRNVHTVFVFSAATGRVKHIWTGIFVRQHDPDFVDGNTISVFDNNNPTPLGAEEQSRILLLSAASDDRTLYYAGDEAAPFYTEIMGKHQWLSNGNLLISESMRGRAFEIDRDGRVVWEYLNVVEDGYAGVLEEVQRLPGRLTAVFSAANVSAQCGAARK